MDEPRTVLIIGSGTFGLSTALHLLRQGKVEVTLLDPYPVPSPWSAGNDSNKIIQTTSDDDFYSNLALEALQMWREDNVFKKAFSETGIIYAATGKEERKSIDYRYKYLIQRNDKVIKLNGVEDYEKYVPSKQSKQGLQGLQGLQASKFQKWYGYYQEKNCGWAFARLALESCAEECRKLGARFIIDSAEKLLYSKDGTCVGVRTSSGSSIEADRIVVCAGASSFKFLNYEHQLLAKCWTLGHIKLADDEAALLKGMPVVLNLDGGFVFEPDTNNEIKFCNEFPGYVNIVDKESVPLFKDSIPKEAEVQMRAFLRQIFPELAERKFSLARICWCTDTPDRHFLICEHPEHKNLILGTGDSGQGFKYMPNVGKYISQVALKGESSLDKDKKKFWRWRPDMGKNRNLNDLQGRYGGSNEVKDLKDVKEWSDGIEDSGLATNIHSLSLQTS
ncbi:uncharacterized protein PRCAT00004981001 [Priceomyces carsonii]|uniref:uncharacterized protein n=1 Tax=Priceomyces carsonii TaxID=28549 RepID=UPI002EDA740F|nr:unnamed protein product [Priceomyces carsonii]